MINGIYLDPRSWKIDCMSYDGWKPEQYGLKITLYDEQSQAKRRPVDKKCKFVIATEVWTPQMQETLWRLKTDYGLKVFMLPRESILAESYKNVMFRYPACKYKEHYFFKPDVVLSPGPHYTEFWKNKTKTINVGHPKFDSYVTNKFAASEEIKKKYKIAPGKKVVFFPTYWDKHYQYDGKVYYADIHQDLQSTMEVLEDIALKNKNIQVVAKVHPITQKLFNKGKGKLDNITKKYYDKDGPVKIVKDVRTRVDIARELLYIADFVLSYRSTMLVEGIFLNKPILNVVFDQCSKLQGMPDFINHIPSVYSKEDLYNTIANGNFDDFIVGKELVDQYFYKVDGQFCKRMCNTIKENL